MRIMFVIIVLGTLAIAGYAAYSIRTVDHNPAEWHVDPLTALPSETPNSYRVAPRGVTEYEIQVEAPIYAVNAARLAQAFDEFVMGQPRVIRLSGTVEEGFITYVQRTEQLQFPDYVSVRFYDLEPKEGEENPTPRSTIAIYSRSRYGYSDMGVNEARVTAWLKAIESFEE